MFALKPLLSNTKNKFLLKNILTRHYGVLYQKDFTVVPFCNININLPFNVTMIPLDIHKYKDYDKVIVKVTCKDEDFTPNFEIRHDKENVQISTNSDFPKETICKIEAPIKANINVNSENGSISLMNFNGESIFLKTNHGNITASRCHCNKISILSTTGNITCSNVMQAAEIYLKTKQNGSVMTGRLQGIDLKVETENGNIKTESSYCTNSTFITETGNLDLQNTHKNCKVLINKQGVLNMTGFDGILKAVLHEGDAEIQLSRIQGDSQIKIERTGSLKIKVSETCLENTHFAIVSKNTHIDEEIKHKINKTNKNSPNNVLIDCQESNVIVQSLSWMEMFNLKRSN